MSGPVLAIDPGPTQSAWVLWNPASEAVLGYGIEPYAQVLNLLRHGLTLVREDLRAKLAPLAEAREFSLPVVIEEVVSYGMAVGREVFQTVRFSGQLEEAWASRWGPVDYLPRLPVKLHLCHSPRANDSNIRAALLDRFGPVGTKKSQGGRYGIASHLWAALALAVTWGDGVRAGRVA